ncbi:type IV pilus modification protein PilV [Dyella mobilis]|uniref:Type IV pilus modification protein PilV n=2 Tax=Dyella mobilis TaxID=1849582 RepID=A0ABS2KMM5_9GAMM|nr:type IV pilus modification protein PilV [Dyella mobilis]
MNISCDASAVCGTTTRRPLNKRSQAGVGLIEVLVAVVILSVGFLGVAALQAMSLSTNNSSMARNMAVIDTYSILDAMRADIGNASSYTGTSVTASSCSTTGTTLSGNQINQWCKQLGNDLGAVSTTKGTISCTTTTSTSTASSTACTVTVQFSDNRSGNGGTNGTGTTAGIQTITTVGML